MSQIIKLSSALLLLWSSSSRANDTITALQQGLISSHKLQLLEHTETLNVLGKKFDAFSLDLDKKLNGLTLEVDKKLSNLSATVGTEVLNKAANPSALVVAGKWRLADTFSDHWLRIYNAAGTDYYGGIAMNTLWVSFEAHLRGLIHMENELQLQASIKWLDNATLRLWDARTGTMGNLMSNRVVANFVNSPTITGTLYGTVKAVSDRRLKNNIADMPPNLEKIKRLQARTYTWNDKAYEAPDFGFIAQELAEIYPDLVTENPEGYKTVNYALLVVPLVKAIQEQQAQIDALNRQLEELKNE